MASSDLARWQRFAGKGGIGKSTALVDCVAERDGDLMFLKDDEITVLMQLPQEGYYLGFCEGVVGRFAIADVRVHGKLKRAVMARRPASGIASPSSSPIALSTTPSPSVPHTTYSPVRPHPIDQITAHARAGSSSLTGSSALLLSTEPVFSNPAPEPEHEPESTPPSSPFRHTSSPTSPLRITTTPNPTPATRESVTSLASTVASPLSDASAYSLRRNPNGNGEVTSLEGGIGTKDRIGARLRDSRSPTTNSRTSSSSIEDPFQHDVPPTPSASVPPDTTFSTLTSAELETPVEEDYDQTVRVGDASHPVEDAYPLKRESTLSRTSADHDTTGARVISAALSDGELGIGLTLIGGLLGSQDQAQDGESTSGSESDYGREDDAEEYEDRGLGYGTPEYGYGDEDTSLYRDDSVEDHAAEEGRLGGETFLGGDITPLAGGTGAVTPTGRDGGEHNREEDGGGRVSPASSNSRSSTPPFGFELEPTVNLEHETDPEAETRMEEHKDAPEEDTRSASAREVQSSPVEPVQQHRRNSSASSASSDYGNELPPSSPNRNLTSPQHSSPSPQSPPPESDSDSDLEPPPVPRPPYHRASASMRSITSSEAGGYYDDGIYDHYRYSHVSMAARSVRMSFMSGNNGEIPPMPDVGSGRRRDWGDVATGEREGEGSQGPMSAGSQGPMSPGWPGSQGPQSPGLHGPKSPGSQGPRSPLAQGQGAEPASPKSTGSRMSPLAAGPVLQAQMEKSSREPLSVVTTPDPSAGLTAIATSGLPPASPSGLTVPVSPLPSSPPSPALSSNLASSLRQAIEQQRAGSGSTATDPDIHAQVEGKAEEEVDEDKPILGSPLAITQPQLAVTPASLQRRPSQFAPHPNAPKPAHLFTAPSASNPPNPTTPSPSTSTFPSGPNPASDAPHPTLPLQDALRLVLQRLRSAPGAGAAGARGSTPTIHGRTHSELALSSGPVPISFVFDPDGWSVRPGSSISPMRMGVGVVGGGSGGHGAQRSASMNAASGGMGGGEYVRSKLRPRSRSFSTVPEEQLNTVRAGGEASTSLEIRASASSVTSAPATPSPLAKPSTPVIPQTPMTPTVPDAPVRAPESPVRSSPSSPTKRVASPPSNPTPSSSSKSPFRGLRTVASNTMMRVGLHSGSVPPSPSHVVKRRSSEILQQQSRVESPAQKHSDDAPRDTLGTHTPSSASISTSPMASSNMSLHSKVSSTGLRTARGTGPAVDTPTTPLSPVGSVQLADETVHVHDMDFDLVKPMRSRVSVVRTSEDASSIPRSSHQSDRPGDDDGQPASPTSPVVASSPMQTQSTTPLVLRAGSHNSLTTPASIAAHISREHRWISTMQTIPSSSVKRNKKIKKLLLEGVPASVRGVVWLYLTDSKARRMAGLYSQLGKRGKVPAMPEILKDIESCFTAQPHLQAPEGPAVSILQAYLTMVPDITYNQGLCQIAGNLLMHSPEEDAFWTFVALMDRHLRGYCAVNSLQMETDSVFFAKALESNEPQVAAKLFRELGIGAIDFCRPWILSGFVGIVPSEYSSRIWDVFLFEGAPFLFRVALALLACLKRQIMALTPKSSPGVLAFLLSIPAQALPADPDQLIASAYAVKFKDDDMRKARPKIEAQLRKEPGFNRPVPIRDALKK